MADDITSVAQPDAIYQLYNSLPVSSKCIRLLQILACEGSQGNDAPLRCHLYVADLESTPSYAALSYVWGTYANPRQHVYCNDVAIPVTSNCHSALRHLRATFGTFTIWVDAICINQKEVNDKMHQIGIMGDIYSMAQTTYVWLGIGSAATDRVMAYLSRAGYTEYYYEDEPSLKQKFDKPRFWGALMSYYKSRWGFRRSTLPHRAGRFSIPLSRSDVRLAPLQLDECSALELTDFFNCVWMSRIWTFQEIILSSSPVVVCGTSSLSWARLEHSVLFLMTVEHNETTLEWADLVLTRELFRAGARNYETYQSDLLKYESCCANIASRARWWKMFTRFMMVVPTTFFAFSSKTGVLATIRWRDWEFTLCTLGFTIGLWYLIIWATIGFEGLAPNPGYSIFTNPYRNTGNRLRLRQNLNKRLVEALRTRRAQEAQDMSWGLRSVLLRLYGDAPIMDSDLPLPEVYEQLTKYLLHKDECLQILSLAAQKHCSGSPSWVPDFSERLGYSKMRDSSYERFMLQYCQRESQPQWYYRFHDVAEKILAVKGVILGEIICAKFDSKPKAHSGTKQKLRTASYRGICFTGGVQIGDKMALIAGLSTPLVLRDSGQHMRIVTAFKLQSKLYRRDVLGEEDNSIKVWKNQEWKSKVDFVRTQSSDARRVRMRDLTPQMYLKDILIA